MRTVGGADWGILNKSCQIFTKPLTSPVSNAIIKQMNIRPPAGHKRAPAEMLSWHSTSPDVYVVRTHKHPPESRHRRWWYYSIPISTLQGARKLFQSFLGFLTLFYQKRVKPPEAFSWRLVDSVCLIQTGVCVFIAHAPGFSFCKFADQERKPPSDEGGGTAKPWRRERQ